MNPVTSSRINTLLEAIKKSPNKRPCWYARHLGLPNKTVMRLLPVMEEKGILLYEDNGKINVWQISP